MALYLRSQEFSTREVEELLVRLPTAPPKKERLQKRGSKPVLLILFSTNAPYTTPSHHEYKTVPDLLQS